MTDTDNIFTIGSVVSVTPAMGEDMQGEVMAFDHKARILVLKMPASNGKSTHCNLITLYTSKVKNINVISEPDSNTPPPPLPQIDMALLRKRMDKAVTEKEVIRTAMSNSAPPDGQQLYLRIAKCFPNTTWSSRNDIIVMDEVAVVAPYTSTCVRPCSRDHTLQDAPTNVKTLEIVKKMVERYYASKREQEQQQQKQQSPSPPQQPSSQKCSQSSSQQSSPQQSTGTVTSAHQKQQQQTTAGDKVRSAV